MHQNVILRAQILKTDSQAKTVLIKRLYLLINKWFLTRVWQTVFQEIHLVLSHKFTIFLDSLDSANWIIYNLPPLHTGSDSRLIALSSCHHNQYLSLPNICITTIIFRDKYLYYIHWNHSAVVPSHAYMLHGDRCYYSDIM